MTAWNLRPIASALWRNRTGALLVAFQIAIGLAVLVNAVYVVKQRVEKIGRPTGMDTANMIWVASAGFAKDYDYDGELARGPRDAARAAGRQGREPLQQHPAVRRRQLERLPGEARRSHAQGDDTGQQLRRRRAGDRGARRQADRGTAVRGERDPAAFGNLRDVAAGDRHPGIREGNVPEGPEPARQDFL